MFENTQISHSVRNRVLYRAVIDFICRFIPQHLQEGFRGRRQAAENHFLNGIYLIDFAIRAGYFLCFFFVFFSFFSAFIQRLLFAYPLEWMEGGIVHHIQRVREGSALYLQGSSDFVPFLYPPFYYWICSLIPAVFSDFFPPRLISLLSTLGTLVLLWDLERKKTDFCLGLLSPVVFLSTATLCGFWFDLARVDSLWIFLLLLAFHRKKIEKSLKKVTILPTVLVFLSALTKQTSLIFLPLFLLEFFALQTPVLKVCAGFSYSDPIRKKIFAVFFVFILSLFFLIPFSKGTLFFDYLFLMPFLHEKIEDGIWIFLQDLFSMKEIFLVLVVLIFKFFAYKSSELKKFIQQRQRLIQTVYTTAPESSLSGPMSGGSGFPGTGKPFAKRHVTSAFSDLYLSIKVANRRFRQKFLNSDLEGSWINQILLGIKTMPEKIQTDYSFVLFLFLAAFLSRNHSGGHLNTLIPAYLAISILIANSLSILEKKISKHVLIVICLIFTLHRSVKIQTFIPEKKHEVLFSESIAAIPSEKKIWIPVDPWIFRKATNQWYAHEMAILDVLRAGPELIKLYNPLVIDLQKNIKNRIWDSIFVQSDQLFSQDLVFYYELKSPPPFSSPCYLSGAKAEILYEWRAKK